MKLPKTKGGDSADTTEPKMDAVTADARLEQRVTNEALYRKVCWDAIHQRGARTPNESSSATRRRGRGGCPASDVTASECSLQRLVRRVDDEVSVSLVKNDDGIWIKVNVGNWIGRRLMHEDNAAMLAACIKQGGFIQLF